MVIEMNEAKLSTVAQLRAFLKGTSEVRFEAAGADTERYAFIQDVLQRFGYARLPRADKGVVLRYLERASGYSRAQIRRLVKCAVGGQRLAKRYRAPRAGFTRRFREEDIALLAATDALHSTLSGPATKKLMQRAYAVFGDRRYQRLAAISVSHLYNLRKRRGYQARRRHWTKTRGRSIPIGQRRAPAPDGRAGFIRIDSVHQGDQDGVKGVYHINAVDCVTQWELVASCEQLSEAYLMPVLQALFESFPFTILGFHADNGSEYINHTVARLLEKLRVEFTKSRPRHSNDNALAETKNGAIVRKHLGYAHIPQHFASQINAFLSEYLNPYVNFHRPCFFPETITDAKGRQRKRYRFETMMTPFEKFKSLPRPEQYLKPGITLKQLDATATAMSDNQAAEQMNQAKHRLFQFINRRSKRAA
jgi:transposase InsO family protein